MVCGLFIHYKSATEPSVYTQTDSHSSAYPVNSYTIPVPLVSEVIKANDGAGSQFIQYKYGDLKLHVAGKGIVGFSSMTTVNLTLGTKETTTVDKWDTDKWIPLQTTTTSTVGGNSSKIISYTTIANNISGQNYYAYTSRKSLTDWMETRLQPFPIMMCQRVSLLTRQSRTTVTICIRRFPTQATRTRLEYGCQLRLP